MKFLALTILLVVCASYAWSKQYNPEKWENFKLKHGKNINPKNEQKRMEKFFDKLSKIEQQNQNFVNGKSKYFADVNQLTDLDANELKQKTGFIPSQPLRSKRSISTNRYAFGPNRPIFRMYSADNGTSLPTSVNWASSGWAEPVWDQQDCGACWAFSAASIVSAQLWIKNKLNVNISQQDFVDCSGYLSTNGCDGGSPANALEYTILNGSSIASVYKYINGQQTCQNTVRKTSPLYNITSFYQLESSHDTLKQAVALLGPISVSINVEDGFFSYSGGIYDGKLNGVMECSPGAINHAVTVVGYGTDTTTKTDYWLIKNTWNKTWGENGYVRMLRTKDNLCGIYTFMYSPVIA